MKSLQVLDAEEKVRYARHLNVPEVGEMGQIQLKNSSVLVVGVGGLGSASSIYLAAAGVGKIGIVDADQVGLSNLQRQILYGVGNIGKEKTDSAEERLVQLNPTISIEKYPLRITKKNVGEVIAPYPIVIDATDNFETRYFLNETCVRLQKVFIYGAVYHFYGQMSVFQATKGPCFQCVFGEPPQLDRGQIAGAGVIGPVPGTIGTLQAMEAIKLIIHQGEPSIGRLVLYDGLDMKFDEIQVKRNPACPVCGAEK